MKAHSATSSNPQWRDASDATTGFSDWSTLFRVGGWGALFTAAMTVLGVVTFLLWPPPVGAAVEVWFAEFNQSWLLGMLGLDLLILLSYVALIPVTLALYVALRRQNESVMLIGATLGLIAIVTYFASSRIFEMLALSQQYTAATTEAERSILLAAGQSMLTTYLGSAAMPAELVGWNYQGTAFNISFVLWSLAGLLISVAMLRSHAFGRVVGAVGGWEISWCLGFSFRK